MPDKVCGTCIWWKNYKDYTLHNTCLRIGDEGDGKQYLDGVEHTEGEPFCYLVSTSRYTCDSWTEDAP